MVLCFLVCFLNYLKLTRCLTIWPALGQSWEDSPGGDQQPRQQMTSLRDNGDMIKIKIMTKVWTTRNLAMLITIMVLVMLAMILLITERELSKYLVEGGIHLLYVGRLMLKWADIVKWDVIMCNGKSMSWFIFVTNITNYIRGEETVMWRNLVFL